jgi:hypothetical protein
MSHNKNYWYLIKEQDIEYKMLEYSLWALTHVQPGYEDLVRYEKNLRKLIDIEDSNQSYYLLSMSYNFSTPMKGYPWLSHDDILSLLQDPKWEHNND